MAKPETNEMPWNNYTQGWTENAKEMVGWQMKAAHTIFDHAIKMSQTFADFYQTQATEGLKLTQACYNSSKGLTEECRRQFSSFAEKAQKTAN